MRLFYPATLYFNGLLARTVAGAAQGGEGASNYIKYQVWERTSV